MTSETKENKHENNGGGPIITSFSMSLKETSSLLHPQGGQGNQSWRTRDVEMGNVDGNDNDSTNCCCCYIINNNEDQELFQYNCESRLDDGKRGPGSVVMILLKDPLGYRDLLFETLCLFGVLVVSGWIEGLRKEPNNLDRLDAALISFGIAMIFSVLWYPACCVPRNTATKLVYEMVICQLIRYLRFCLVNLIGILTLMFFGYTNFNSYPNSNVAAIVFIFWAGYAYRLLAVIFFHILFWLWFTFLDFISRR